MLPCVLVLGGSLVGWPMRVKLNFSLLLFGLLLDAFNLFSSLSTWIHLLFFLDLIAKSLPWRDELN